MLFSNPVRDQKVPFSKQFLKLLDIYKVLFRFINFSAIFFALTMTDGFTAQIRGYYLNTV